MNDEPATKKPKNIEEQCCIDENFILDNFLTWLNNNGIYISEKMKISKKGSCSRYGAIAVENITTGDLLFSIPRYFCVLRLLLKWYAHVQGCLIFTTCRLLIVIVLDSRSYWCDKINSMNLES